MSSIAIFSGSAHPALAEEICAKLDVPLLPTRLKRFSNDCIEVQLQANCREQDVFLIQPLSSPVQDHLVELLLMLDAARGASAARITAVVPHYAYARSDKKDAPRISIGGVWSPTCWRQRAPIGSSRDGHADAPSSPFDAGSDHRSIG